MVGALRRTLIGGCFTALCLLTNQEVTGQAAALRWDTLKRTVASDSGANNATVTFWVTNVSTRPITIVRIKPSCACTSEKRTKIPLHLAPKRSSRVFLDTDIRGKRGFINKSAQVFSSAGVQKLEFKIVIGANPTSMNRQANLAIAKSNRQAVFRGNCANCHAKPTRGRNGKDLFEAACGICHEAKHRASMVPDLRHHPLPENRQQWLQLITNGKPNSLMPAFGKEHGGPLSPQQIESLANYLAD